MAVLKKTLVTVRAEQDQLGMKINKDALFKVDNHFSVSSVPKMHALVLHDRDPLLSFIRKTGVFVMNFLDTDFNENKIELIEADKVFCKKIEDADHLECEVVNEIETGDSWIVIGHVLG